MIQIGDKMPAFCAADQFGKDWCDEDGICTEVIKKVDTKNASAQILK